MSSRGGARPGAGRPFKTDEDKRQRPQHQVRAHDDEWALIKEFAEIVKRDPERAKRILGKE